MLKNLASIAATAIVLLILLASSVPLMHWFVSEGREADFFDNEALWSSHGISDYDFTVNMTCACPPPAGKPVRIRIREGRVTSAHYRQGVRNNTPVDTAGIPDSVAAMFAAVRSGIDADLDSISVTYDGHYGFPALIEMDRRSAYPDDEVTITISEFEPIDDTAN